jgi:hypothetical protein
VLKELVTKRAWQFLPTPRAKRDELYNGALVKNKRIFAIPREIFDRHTTVVECPDHSFAGMRRFCCQRITALPPARWS